MARFNRQVDIVEDLGDFSPVGEFIRAFREIEDAARRCEIIIKLMPYLYQRTDAVPMEIDEQAELLRLIKSQ